VQEMKQDWGSLKIKLSVCNVWKCFNYYVFAKGSVQVVLNITSPCSQYCGGTSFITKLLDSVIPSSETPTVLLDLFGFDGWPGSVAVSQAARGILVILCYIHCLFSLPIFIFLFLCPK
jgi:hypothetical protein